MKMHKSQTLALLDIYKKSCGQVLDICGKHLSIAQLRALDKVTKVNLNEKCKQQMQESFDFLTHQLENGACIYGANTGYGGSADVRSSKGQELQLSLVRLLNAGFGDCLQDEHVKAVMLVRCNSLCQGYSGIRPLMFDLLLEMINHNLLPVIPKRGSISASGDLMPLSYIAACMAGREDAMVRLKGQLMSAPEGMAKLHLTPISFEAKEALALVNAGSVAGAVASQIIFDANISVLLTQAATAMSVEALCGTTESFHPTIHKLLSHPGQREVAENILHLLQGSLMCRHVGDHCSDEEGELRQDRYSLRTSPQWLGPVLETMVHAMKRITTEINSVSDNPIIDAKNKLILNGGNFQATSVTVAMDQVRQALQLCGKLLHGQMQELVNVSLNHGLTPNLAGSDVRTDFGSKGQDIAMTAYMSELDYLTNPLTNHVLSAELYNQSVNSMALVSARYTEQGLEILQMMLCNILYTQVQAIDLRWLQKKVESHLSCIEKIISPNRRYTEKKMIWYQVAFSPKESRTILYEYNMTNKDHIDKELDEIEKLVDDMRHGKHVKEVAAALGKGCSQLYIFLRQELDIPFNHGNDYIDRRLTTIFNSVKNLDIVDLIENMFTKI